MSHIEQGLCEGRGNRQPITLDRFEEEKAKKQIMKEVYEEERKTEPRRAVIHGASTIAAASSVDGGVQIGRDASLLNDSLLDRDLDQDPQEDDSTELLKAKTSNTRAREFMASMNQWPSLPNKSKVQARLEDQKAAKETDEAESDLMTFTEITRVADNVPGWTKKLFSNAPTPRPMSTITSGSGASQWDPYVFFDGATQKFVCKCGAALDTPEGLKNHLLDKHRSSTATCPSCHRIFKNVTALAQHAETATVRCDINKSIRYREFVRDLTAGIVDVGGHNIDGSVKYAANAQWQDNFVAPDPEYKPEPIW